MKLMNIVVEILDKPNRNGRTYSKEVMQKVIDSDYQKLGMLGMYGGGVDFEKVSHKIENLRIVDDELLCDVTILETPKGKILSEISSLVSPIYRLSGFCNIDADGIVSDYTMISVNAVKE